MPDRQYPLLLLLFGCAFLSQCADREVAVSGACPHEQVVRLATTTSTENSGLLDVLLPPFTQASGIRVDVISVGTGKALAYGRNGDVDAVLVHARAAEDKFVAEGAGVNRRDVMYNDFVIVGPAGDPAQVGGTSDPVAALAAIEWAGALFVSRGDDSGTHKREMKLWELAEIEPSGRWYMAVGQGMGAALAMADEKIAYCLTDRGTWLAFRRRLDLKVLVERGPGLHNPYGIIAVNPARHTEVNYVGAMALVNWLTSPPAQGIIAAYVVEDTQLFHPGTVSAK